MQTPEKVGVGVAGIAMLVMMGALIGTRPDVPDPAPASQARAASVLEKVQTISTGESVDIPPYLQTGVRTVVEFSAEW